MVKLHHLEVLTQEQLAEKSLQIQAVLQKSLTAELTKAEREEVEAVIDDIASYDRWEVLCDDLSKAVCYTRREQVLWEDAERGEFGEIIKARSGIYKDTPENRKLGRVGQKYGSEKKPEEKPTEGKTNQVDEQGKRVSYWKGPTFEGKFVNGKAEGSWKFYDHHKRLMSEGQFKNGDYDGPWKYYYKNGQLEMVGSYKNGKYDGLWKFYDENGNLKSEAQFKDGKMLSKEETSEEKPSEKKPEGKEEKPSEGKINQYDEHGEKHGFWKEFSPEERYVYEGRYEHGKREGLWKNYYRGGEQLMSEGAYKNGKEEGPWKWYDVHGQLVSEGSFKNGVFAGPCRLYHRNGQLRAKGLYKNGQRYGVWKYYDANGQLVSER